VLLPPPVDPVLSGPAGPGDLRGASEGSPGLAVLALVNAAPRIVRPDLVFWKAGRVHLADWASAKPRASDRLQLACYALFAQYRWHVRPEEIVVSTAYLRDGVVSPGFLSPDELTLARGVVESGYRQLAKAVPRGRFDSIRSTSLGPATRGSASGATSGSCVGGGSRRSRRRYEHRRRGRPSRLGTCYVPLPGGLETGSGMCPPTLACVLRAF